MSNTMGTGGFVRNRQREACVLFYIIHSLCLFFSFEEFHGVNNMRSYAEKRIKGSKGGLSWHPGVYRQGLERENSFGSSWVKAEAEGVAGVHSTQGVGFLPGTRINNARGKERQHLVHEEVWAGVEEVRASGTVGMEKQGASQQKITWSDIWKVEFHHMKILVQPVYDALPRPANFHLLGKSETPSCPLSSERGTLELLLSSSRKPSKTGTITGAQGSCWEYCHCRQHQEGSPQT